MIQIDPIIKLEFLRGAYGKDLLTEKNHFLNGNHAIPLGDILIQARLMRYKERCLFLTKDQGDFSTVLFDRKAVISIEKPNKQGRLYLEHLILLKFNYQKFSDCLEKLPEKLYT